MKTFAIHTLGCKVNQYESQQIIQLLLDSGLSPSRPHEQPSLAVINSCCVTSIASAKSRQAVRKMLRRYPDIPVILVGCLPAGDADELRNLAGSNLIIIADKERLPAEISQLLHNSRRMDPPQCISKTPIPDKIKDKNHSNSLAKHDLPKSLKPLSLFAGHSRAFLKVQDGCDAFCSYCIIPRIRTKVCYKAVNSVLQEAQKLIDSGHKEIVLTGIFLGAYGQTTARRKKWDSNAQDNLPDLLEKLAGLPGMERIRLSSLEPADVTDRLLDVMKNHPNIMPHLHLPLQSGSAIILRKMCRQYAISEFIDVVNRVKTALDCPAITTDIIVGFPGETDADFEQTIEVAKAVGFAKIHVFGFSVRKNTPAAKMPNHLPANVIHQRTTILSELDRHLQSQYKLLFIDDVVNVLVESKRPPAGRCERYFMVNLSSFPESKNLKSGQIIPVKLTRAMLESQKPE